MTNSVRRGHAVREELSLLWRDATTCLRPVVTQYWVAAVAVLGGVQVVLGMLGTPAWVAAAAACAALFGFFGVLLNAWRVCQSAQGRPRRRFWLGAVLLSAPPVAMVPVLALLLNPPAPRQPSLVIVAQGAHEDFFAYAFAEDLKGRLQALPGFDAITVRADTAGTERTPARQLARQAGASHVLELRASRGEAGVHATSRLGRARGRGVLLNGTHDGTIAQVQLELASAIADRLGVALAPEARALLAAAPTQSDSAYHLYLRARGMLYAPVGGYAKAEEAIGMFHQAIALDHTFGLAYAGLARGYQVRGNHTSDEKWHAEARRVAERAVALAPREERARAALGLVLREGGHFGQARVHLLEAMKLSPTGGDGSARSNLGLVYFETGRLYESVRLGVSAVRIEPSSFMARLRVGQAYEALGDAGRAEQWYRSAIDAAGSAAEARFRLATLYWATNRAARGDTLMRGVEAMDGGPCFRFQWDALNGRMPLARRTWQRGREDGVLSHQCAPLLAALVLRGTAEADSALRYAADAAQAMLDRKHEGALPRLMLAQVHALRGDAGEANRWLGAAVDAGYRNAREAARLPTLEAVRETDAFRALQGRMQTLAAEEQESFALEGHDAPPPVPAAPAAP